MKSSINKDALFLVTVWRHHFWGDINSRAMSLKELGIQAASFGGFEDLGNSSMNLPASLENRQGAWCASHHYRQKLLGVNHDDPNPDPHDASKSSCFNPKCADQYPTSHPLFNIPYSRSLTVCINPYKSPIGSPWFLGDFLFTRPLGDLTTSPPRLQAPPWSAAAQRRCRLPWDLVHGKVAGAARDILVIPWFSRSIEGDRPGDID